MRFSPETQQYRHTRSKGRHRNKKECVPVSSYSRPDSGTDLSVERESEPKRQSRKKNSDSDSEPERNIESGSHLDNQPRRKKRFTKKKSDRKKTSNPLQPHAKRNVNLADDNEPNDETQVGSQ